MKQQTFHNIPELCVFLDSIAGNCDLVSFDLFDTLVVRRVSEPDDLKAPVAAFASKLLHSHGVRCSAADFQRARDSVEREHRLRNGQEHPDMEADYRQFMHEAIDGIVTAADGMEPVSVEELYSRIAAYELHIEKSMTVARQDFLPLLSRLKKQDKRLVIITDIYLPSDMIRDIVRHVGLELFFEDIVSSADTFRAKASGTVFPDLARKYGVEFSRWVHVGDNPVSDGLRPKSHGIRALLLRDTGEKHRKAVYRRYKALARKDLYWRGRLLNQVMLPLEAENTDVSRLYALGYGFFGVMINAFVLRIAERVREMGIRRVYFFSREGATFLKAWNVIAPVVFGLEDIPDARYLYVSRLAVAGASCARQGLIHTNAHLSLLPAGNRDMKDLCRIFGLDIGRLSNLLAGHGLSEDTPLNPIHKNWTMDNRHKLDAFLSDPEVQEEIKGQTVEKGRLLERYLEQEHFFDQPDVAVVDMGWLGTIQRFLYEAVAHRDDAPVFHGFLFAASRGIPYPTSPSNTVEGCVFDRERFDFRASTVNYALDLFEEACRAPHAGVMGYRDNGGKTEPVFRQDDDPERCVEKVQDEYYSDLQKGMFDSCESFARALDLHGYSFADIEPWVHQLMVDHMAFPKTEEVKTLKWVHHLDDFGGVHGTPLRIRLIQARLWDMSPAVLRWVPFVREFFYAWHAWRNRAP